MRVFSPSATKDFLTCPLYWHLRRTGMQPRRLGKKGLSGILGTSFSAGVAAYNLARKEGIEATPARVANYGDLAASVVRQHLKEADDAGLVTTGSIDIPFRNSLEDRARKLIKTYAEQDPLPPQWRVEDVELTMDEAGYCRLDVGLQSDLGPVVVDYKTKVSYDTKYADRDRDDWRDSEQRFHYSYFYGQRKGQPTWQFAICLVILEPKPRVLLIPFVNNQEVLERWYRGRLLTWSRMEASLDLALEDQEMAGEHSTRFGPCEMHRHCFEDRGDIDMSVTSGDFVVMRRD